MCFFRFVFVNISCSDVGALDASLGMRVQLALGRSWPLESHLPGAPASGLTEKKIYIYTYIYIHIYIYVYGLGASGFIVANAPQTSSSDILLRHHYVLVSKVAFGL